MMITNFEQMMYLYTRFSVPYLVLDKETGEIIKDGVRWLSEGAENLYNYLREKESEQIRKNAEKLWRYSVRA